MNKSVGDTLRLTGSIYRIVGIYETGSAFEDSGAVMGLKDSQELLGRQRQVSLYYIRLKEPAMRERFLMRVERQWPDFSVSGVKEYSEKQSMTEMMSAFVWVIGSLAIVIGGVGMMNSQLMAIMERTREIGVLRAVGWSSKRVLWMILMESILVCLLGGLVGISIAYLLISDLSRTTTVLGLNTRNRHTGLIDPGDERGDRLWGWLAVYTLPGELHSCSLSRRYDMRVAAAARTFVACLLEVWLCRACGNDRDVPS